jgi:hypothetical protein
MQLDQDLQCLYGGKTETITVPLEATFADISHAMCRAFLLDPDEQRIITVRDNQGRHITAASTMLQHPDRGPWRLEVQPRHPGAGAAAAGVSVAAPAKAASRKRKREPVVSTSKAAAGAAPKPNAQIRCQHLDRVFEGLKLDTGFLAWETAWHHLPQEAQQLFLERQAEQTEQKEHKLGSMVRCCLHHAHCADRVAGVQQRLWPIWCVWRRDPEWVCNYDREHPKFRECESRRLLCRGAES